MKKTVSIVFTVEIDLPDNTTNPADLIDEFISELDYDISANVTDICEYDRVELLSTELTDYAIEYRIVEVN